MRSFTCSQHSQCPSVSDGEGSGAKGRPQSIYGVTAWSPLNSWPGPNSLGCQQTLSSSSARQLPILLILVFSGRGGVNTVIYGDHPCCVLQPQQQLVPRPHKYREYSIVSYTDKKLQAHHHHARGRTMAT